MTPIQRQAILLTLISRLRDAGSWCGETHIQKTAYFAQEVFGVPLGFNFILYKHGPYSFELKDELTALLADRLVVVKPEEQYGSHFYPSAGAAAFLARFPKTTAEHGGAVERVARLLGPKNASELERLATALYVFRDQPADGEADRVARICRIKPHVTPAEAQAALRAVKELVTPAVEQATG